MAKYTGTVLTNKGKELLVRAILGEAIVFTKVEIGKGTLSPGTNKESLTSLIDSFKILSITSTTNLPNGGYRIRISFNNKGFKQDTYLREVGVFARGEDGAEILYSYCNTDTPNLIPNESSGIIESVEDIITYISSAATINAVIDESHVYATIKDLVEGLATKEDKFNKNEAFNKTFGTTTGTIMEGDKRATDLGGEPSFSKNSGFNKNKSDSVTSNDSNTLATSKAAKIAYDRGSSGITKADTAQNSANSAQTKANEAYTLANGKEPKFNKKTGFNLDITHLVNSTSRILVASALAVKTVYDKALEAIGFTNTNKNAIQNNTEQIENLLKWTLKSTLTGHNPYIITDSYSEVKINSFSSPGQLMKTTILDASENKYWAWYGGATLEGTARKQGNSINIENLGAGSDAKLEIFIR